MLYYTFLILLLMYCSDLYTYIHVSRYSSVSLTYVSIVIVIEVRRGRTTARDMIVSFIAMKHSGNNYPHSLRCT